MNSATGQWSTEEFAGRLFAASLGAGELAGVYIGDRLGLYRKLAEAGPLTPRQLAQSLGLAERYVREWLEQQAVSSVLAVNDASLPEDERTYSLPAEHAVALIDPDDPNSMAPLARSLVAVIKTLPLTLEAFQTGGGVPWSDFGADMIESQGDFNRPWLVNDLASNYLPKIPDIQARLQAQPPAKVLDVACGLGWAAIAIARGYPGVQVDALDSDEQSIELAKQYAGREPEISSRIDFRAMDASKLASEGPYDLAIIVESVHDMSDPVAVLSGIRRVLAPNGSLIVADERVAERFMAPGDEAERLFYCFSVLCCLPAGKAEGPSAETGTVMRASTLERYAAEAGFRSTTTLELEHPLLRFYRLDP